MSLVHNIDNGDTYPPLWGCSTTRLQQPPHTSFGSAGHSFAWLGELAQGKAARQKLLDVREGRFWSKIAVLRKAWRMQMGGWGCAQECTEPPQNADTRQGDKRSDNFGASIR